MQVTIIGGGSYQWSPKLITDLLAVGPLADMHLVLEDIDPAPLAKMEVFARKANEKMGTKMTVETTTDQRRAVDGADFVIVTISTGGFDSMAFDIDIPAKYGIRQSVGDSVGPGGISRSLRNIPILVSIGRDMEQGCPDAWMLNITNPMTCLTRSVCRETSIKTVGLCHEVGNFAWTWPSPSANPTLAIRPTVVGVNHFPVITELDIDGADGFVMLLRHWWTSSADWKRCGPVRRAPSRALHQGRFRPAARPQADPPRPLRRLPGAGDRHVAEFIPSALTEASGWGQSWGFESHPHGPAPGDQAEFVAEVDAVLAGTAEVQTWDSGEIVAPVIDSLSPAPTGSCPSTCPTPGSVPTCRPRSSSNRCAWSTATACGAATPPTPRPAITEWVRRQVAVQELTVEAAVTGDRETALQAFALDPLAGRGDLRATEAMADELLAATARWLPQFAS
jgi:alpha-galactosidase/6-phospho-beta-glucosidase family protein